LTDQDRASGERAPAGVVQAVTLSRCGAQAGSQCST
jgi:hypothetical protein